MKLELMWAPKLPLLLACLNCLKESLQSHAANVTHNLSQVAVHSPPFLFPCRTTERLACAYLLTIFEREQRNELTSRADQLEHHAHIASASTGGIERISNFYRLPHDAVH